MREELRGVLQAYYIGIGGSVAWGNIVGDIENQLNLMAQFNARVPVSRTISINGQTYDLSENRSWTVNTNNYSDADFTIYDDVDNTKVLNFSVGGVSTGTTRTLTVPNASGTIALTSDLSAYLTTAAAISTYVPYTGATSALNLGANNFTVDTNVLFVDAANNRVGIGTTTPNSQFTVKGNTDAAVEIAGSSAGRRGLLSYFNAPAVFEINYDNNFRFRRNEVHIPLLLDINGGVTINYIEGNLKFSGTTSSFPALKRSSTELQVRLADDSGFAPFSAAATTINGNLTVDTNVLFVDATNNWVRIGTTGNRQNDLLEISRNSNSVTGFSVSNTTSDASARARFSIESNANRGVFFNVFSDGWTANPSYTAGSAALECDMLNGFQLRVLPSASLSFWTNNLRRGSFTSAGLFAIGDTVTSTSPALKRSSTELQVRLADDSGYAPFRAAATIFESGIIGGTSLNSSAIFQVDSTSKGILIPRMTGGQVEGIGTPIESLLAFASNAGSTDVKVKGFWAHNGSNWTKIKQGKDAIITAASDETTALTTGTSKLTFRMPYAFKLTEVRASLSTAQTSGSAVTVDVNKNGSTIFTTRVTIDNTEKTSTTAATPSVLSVTDFSDDDEITVDIDTIGDGTAKGLKVTLIGYAL